VYFLLPNSGFWSPKKAWPYFSLFFRGQRFPFFESGIGFRTVDFLPPLFAGPPLRVTMGIPSLSPPPFLGLFCSFSLQERLAPPPPRFPPYKWGFFFVESPSGESSFLRFLRQGFFFLGSTFVRLPGPVLSDFPLCLALSQGRHFTILSACGDPAFSLPPLFSIPVPLFQERKSPPPDLDSTTLIAGFIFFLLWECLCGFFIFFRKVLPKRLFFLETLFGFSRIRAPPLVSRRNVSLFFYLFSPPFPPRVSFF